MCATGEIGGKPSLQSLGYLKCSVSNIVEHNNLLFPNENSFAVIANQPTYQTTKKKTTRKTYGAFIKLFKIFIFTSPLKPLPAC